jgi:hypothetical protein
VLRQHCEAEQRNFNSIERTNLTSLLLARTDAELLAKRDRLGVPAQFRGYALTVAQAIDLIGEFQKAGSQLFITSFIRNDWESMELLAGDIMPHFAG